MDLSPVSHESMRAPAPFRVLLISFVAAFLLNLLPWSGVALQARPDFVLLILLYWSVYEPRSVGQGLAFFLGLLMDVADSALLGQHALTYGIAVFFTLLLRVRVLQLNLPAQALHIGAILLLVQFISVSLNLSLGRELSDTWLLMAPVAGAILWPAVSLILAMPRFRRRSGQFIG